MFKVVRKTIAFIRKHEFLSIFALLLLIVIISYGKTLNMYWWVDDWGLLYKMVYPMKGAGNLGGGLWGQGAYRYLATPFILLYSLFGTNAQPYFALGLAQYLLAAIVVYFFAKELTQNKLIALGAGIIFASGYVGSFALYRLSNSYQLSDTTILVYLAALFLVKYLRNRGKRNYFISLVIYIAALIFMFLRAHGAIAVIFFTFAFWTVVNWKKEKGKILNRVVLFLPFLATYYYYYFYNYMGGSKPGGVFSNTFLGKTVNEIFVQKHYFLIGNLFHGLSSAFFPNAWAYSLYDLLRKHVVSLSTYLANADILVIDIGYLYFLFLWLAPLIFKKYRKYLIYLPLLSLFVLGNVLTYFVNNPFSQLESYSRYMMTAFVGSAIAYSCMFFALSEAATKLKKYKRLLFYGPLAILCVSFISLSYKFQDEILKYVSYATQDAYRVIKKTVPRVDGNTVFFIDTEDEPRVKNNVLSGMPELGISIFYGYDGTTKFVYTYDQLYSQILSKKIDLNNFYTFFESEKLGFVPTIEDLKKALSKKLLPKRIDSWSYLNEAVFIDTPIGYPSLMPTAVNLTISFKPDKATVGKIPIKVWWMTERRNTYQLFYAQDLAIFPDGLAHFYTIYIPAGGLTIQNLRIDGYPAGKIKVLNSSIVNLTLPELKGKNIINN